MRKQKHPTNYCTFSFKRHNYVIDNMMSQTLRANGRGSNQLRRGVSWHTADNIERKDLVGQGTAGQNLNEGAVVVGTQEKDRLPGEQRGAHGVGVDVNADASKTIIGFKLWHEAVGLSLMSASETEKVKRKEKRGGH